MIDRLPSKQVVLLGIGHTNAHVLRMWGMNAIPDTGLTCLSNYSVATYSGMLPAVLAGQCRTEQMEIDLVKLCASVGARLIQDAVTGIDHDRQEVLFEQRPAVPFDVLSVGIGSVPSTEGLKRGEDRLIRIKPMQTFLDRLAKAIDLARAGDRQDSRLNVLVVGGGVAGSEIAFCLPPFLRRSGGEDYSIGIVTSSAEVLPDAIASTRRRVSDEMRRRDVRVTGGRRVVSVEPHMVELDDGSTLEADIVIWATGATAPPMLEHLGMPQDDRGFLATDRTLRSVGGGPVFAVGDTGTIVSDSLPKAGVYAVRQGPILWQNIGRLLGGRSLQPYVPQRSFLRLINLGNDSAIGQWKGMSFSGTWVWKLKDSIDRRFMEKYRPQPMMDDDGEPMQCRGCGCKLGGDVLESALGGYKDGVKLEDAAEIGGDPKNPLVASTDFFSSPIDDAFLAGRIAALHAASDIIATGARPSHALANLVIPEGDRRAQLRTMTDFNAGATLEFEAMGAAIVGGHTIVGPRMEVGFTVVGKSVADRLIKKENLVVGDELFLTKPIGIGILLAAHARSACPGPVFDALIDAMLARQHSIAEIAAETGVVAGTDVTGFGLAGHLLEMLDSSGVSAQLRLESIPLLPGVSECIGDGIESSLAPDNRRIASRIDGAGMGTPACEALFDPQTCGGLLLGVSPQRVDAWRDAFESRGLPRPVSIGHVCRREDSKVVLQLV